MKYVYGLPDDYFFYPDGDSICSRIINHAPEILPPLVEKITDTVPSQIKVADSYYYVVGDIAMILVEWITCRNEELSDIHLTKIIVDEFYANDSILKNSPPVFHMLHYKTFVENSEEENLCNRQIVYERIKEILNY